MQKYFIRSKKPPFGGFLSILRHKQQWFYHGHE